MLNQILENFRFLVIESRNQVNLTLDLLDNSNESLMEKIADKDDYIDNLKNNVENDCFSRIHGEDDVTESEVNRIRSIHVMSLNLERIADFCVNIARQIEYLTDPAFIRNYDYAEMFSLIQNSMAKILRVFDEGDLSGALDICRTELFLDGMYKTNFDRIMSEFGAKKESGDLVTVIFIFRYLERIGDSLLNIGEALIFTVIGDRIKIRQFEALEKTLTDFGFEGTLSDIHFTSILGSRSGCRIGRIAGGEGTGVKTPAIFKEGVIAKIRREKENIQRWEEIAPGLTPRIFGYYEKNGKASLLVEHLFGCTFEEMILTGDSEIYKNAAFILEQTLLELWETTKQQAAFTTDYMRQLQSRMDGVLRVHPDFVRRRQQMHDSTVNSTGELIKDCETAEARLPAPFTVLIHGDFNVNNIVYDHEGQRIHYIDLYRSREADYAQDAAVFLTSNFRLPIFEPRIRSRIDTTITAFFGMFTRFALKNQDNTFEARMALSLARSLYTSARFELNRSFAKEMILRAHFLMEKIQRHENRSWERFSLPMDVLYY